jgi:His/Glu/Gln/Arg/opine family amino acid ABC transporter permease subunit
MTEFKWSVVFDNADVFLQGLVLTLQLSAVSAVIATVLGLVVALGRMSPFKPLAWLSLGFINIVRAIPPFVLIIYVYYGVSMALDINFSAFTAGVIALSLQYTAWIAEVYRSGIEAVPVGQHEAASSLAFGKLGAFVTIVLPQALRIVIPPLGNNLVGLVKDSSLVSFIGVVELVRNSQLLVSQTFRPFEIYTATVVLYLAITVVISLVFTWLEKRYSTKRPTNGKQPRLSRSRLRRLLYLEQQLVATRDENKLASSSTTSLTAPPL